MKPSFSFFILCICVFSATAQVNDLNQNHAPCGYDQIESQLRIDEPQNYALYQQVQQSAMEAVRNQRNTPATAACPNGIRIIPIYFHVLHNNGNPNIPGDNNFTVAEISQAVNELNLHYQGTNPELSRVHDIFSSSGVVSTNTCIQFCWNPTDVTRVNVSLPLYDTIFNSQNKIKAGWEQFASAPKNRCQYMNVYTGHFGTTFSAGDLNGFAVNLLYESTRVAIDDNVFVPFGLITNPGIKGGMTFVHEVAHYLGIPHIWGNENIPDCDSSTRPFCWDSLNTTRYCHIDDGFSDTPLQARPSSGPGPGVPTFFQNESIFHCGNTLPVMWTNIMDYSPNTWRVNFTKEQAAFMHQFLTLTGNLLPSKSYCNTGLGFLKGEAYCNGSAISCLTLPAVIHQDTLKICNSDTINLHQYLDDWGYNSNISPTTEYTWRRGSLTGTMVDYPTKTIIKGNSPICKPEQTEFFLNIKCATTGNEELGGKLVVLAYATPEQLVKMYLRDGDCQSGPGPVFSSSDLAAGCNNLITFTPVNPPSFPATVSGQVNYSVTFDASILGPCCTSNCTRSDTAYYQCQGVVNDCPSIAVGGGASMIILESCPDFDFNDLFDGYENQSVSLFDPQGNVNDFYYYSDPLRTKPFDPATDFIYDGNGCNKGSDVVIYTSIGCDPDHNGIANIYIPIGTITMNEPAPFPQAPAITYTINANQECVYNIVAACSQDDITPSPLPIETCGSNNLPPVTFSVLSRYDCEKQFVVAKPDCPNCFVSNCAVSNFTGGTESVCSGNSLSGGFPNITITGSTGPVTGIVWANGNINLPGTSTYPDEGDDLPGDTGPVFISNANTGMPETQTLNAYAVCDDDNDPDTDPVYALLGQYVVIVNPVPDGRIVPVCMQGDSTNFYVEVELYSNNAGHTFTATNSFNASSLTFSNPDTKLLGPFPNGSSVVVDFAIDGGCSLISQTLITSCLQSSCTPPDISFIKNCVGNNTNQYTIETGITGNTSGYLYEVTNSINTDTAYIDFLNPVINMGPFASSNFVEITVTDYTHRQCVTTSGILTDSCLITHIEENEVLSFAIYPNPAKSTITVAFQNMKEGKAYQFTIFDMLGKMMFAENSVLPKGAHEIVIPVAQLSSGVYFLKAFSADRQTGKTGKFIKY